MFDNLVCPLGYLLSSLWIHRHNPFENHAGRVVPTVQVKSIKAIYLVCLKSSLLKALANKVINALTFASVVAS